MKKILLTTTLCSLLLLGCSSSNSTAECTKDQKNSGVDTKSTYEIEYKDNTIVKTVITAKFTFSKEAENKEDYKTILVSQEDQLKDVKQLDYKFSEKDNVLTTVTTTDYEGIDARKYVEYAVAFDAALDKDGNVQYDKTKEVLEDLGFTCK